MKRDVLGLAFDDLRLPEAVDRALWLMGNRRGGYVCTPNPEVALLCHENPEHKAAVQGAELILPDGVGILLGARILGRPLKERVAGIDFCQSLLKTMKGTVFLLGAKPGVAERAAERIAAEYPQVTVLGCSDGYFADEAALWERIRTARPDLLLVCLGTPRQELFMARHAGDEAVGLMAGLGGTLDVLSGDVPRAPDFFIRHKAEWLWRLLREPKRIKRQIRLPRYLWAVAVQRIRHE